MYTKIMWKKGDANERRYNMYSIVSSEDINLSATKHDTILELKNTSEWKRDRERQTDREGEWTEKDEFQNRKNEL